MQNQGNYNKPISIQRWTGLAGGIVVFILMVCLSPPEGLSKEGWMTASVGVLMAIWWVSEAIPISATALVPIVLFPLLNIGDIKSSTMPYANPMIFLFMGGFIIAIAMQEWGLHKRIALNIIKLIGFKPKSIILGFMISAAFMSMWVSNTAATLMMLPIALSVIEMTISLKDKGVDAIQQRNFAVVLMLGIAYSSNIGGIGTVIGTPTNALLIGFVNESYGIEISFIQWLLMGLPVVILGLPIVFFTLTGIVFPVKFKTLPGGKEYIQKEVSMLGKISRAEKLVLAIFLLVALLWIIRPFLESFLPGISDAGIAIFGALLLFLTPLESSRGKFLLTWKAAEKLPWGVLILFGGGLTLAGAIQRTGLAEWIGGYFIGLHGTPFILVTLIVTAVVIMFTELTSNSATAAAFLPIMGSVALGMGESPLLLAIPVAMAASCAFMLPVATPPNAIVYGSGFITIPQMVRAGLWLNLFFAILISILAYKLFFLILGI
jgi:solute carrier family 13 (sodium-dependent dicarboxylate transporter), member 2/3/5